MAEPLTALLFHYGRFDAHDLEMTRRTVLAYSVGLLGLIAVKILAPGFYGKQDVRTPFRIAIVILLVTQALNLAFVPWLQHAGLALSISVAALANAGLLLAGLLRRGIYVPRPGWLGFTARVAAALALLALLLWLAVPRVDWVAMRAQPALRIGLAVGLVAAGAAVYLGTLAALGLRLRQFVRRTGDLR
jgi:putative peptidoglycan lipid II flippase